MSQFQMQDLCDAYGHEVRGFRQFLAHRRFSPVTSCASTQAAEMTAGERHPT
jgi:hypothetical protein